MDVIDDDWKLFDYCFSSNNVDDDDNDDVVNQNKKKSKSKQTQIIDTKKIYVKYEWFRCITIFDL